VSDLARSRYTTVPSCEAVYFVFPGDTTGTLYLQVTIKVSASACQRRIRHCNVLHICSIIITIEGDTWHQVTLIVSSQTLEVVILIKGV